mmetsp:Transcript_53087/g.60139  ORF Transcript_53087/g.60139 Transcript_53087/m.60139 type:complete len:113 (+) Transcript_53087:66-404(+)
MTRSTVTKEGKNRDKHTSGEELYLVHLQRLREDDEDDHDQPSRKRLSSSLGEELWEIHMRRSTDSDSHSDRDVEVNDSDKKDLHHSITKSPLKKCSTTKYCEYNLRSKDRKV